jgi:hypothetical protein
MSYSHMGFKILSTFFMGYIGFRQYEQSNISFATLLEIRKMNAQKKSLIHLPSTT